MMRYCPSYHVVHLMREGLAVQGACDRVILEMKERHGAPFEVAIIALNMKVRKWVTELVLLDPSTRASRLQSNPRVWQCESRNYFFL